MPFVGENCRMQYGNNNIDSNIQLINTIDYTHQLLVHFEYLQP